MLLLEIPHLPTVILERSRLLVQLCDITTLGVHTQQLRLRCHGGLALCPCVGYTDAGLLVELLLHVFQTFKDEIKFSVRGSQASSLKYEIDYSAKAKLPPPSCR